jgi:hypothetical protein
MIQWVKGQECPAERPASGQMPLQSIQQLLAGAVERKIRSGSAGEGGVPRGSSTGRRWDRDCKKDETRRCQLESSVEGLGYRA